MEQSSRSQEKSEQVFNPDNNDEYNEIKQNSVLKYDPYENNYVLLVKNTSDNILLLLKKSWVIIKTFL